MTANTRQHTVPRQTRVPWQAGTPWENSVFIVDVEFPQDYPFHGFMVDFRNKFWHPNVQSNGHVTWPYIRGVRRMRVTCCRLCVRVCKCACVCECTPDTRQRITWCDYLICDYLI